MYTCDVIIYFKRSKESKPESILITTSSDINYAFARMKMSSLISKAEKLNNPNILLGSDIASVSSVWY